MEDAVSVEVTEKINQTDLLLNILEKSRADRGERVGQEIIKQQRKIFNLLPQNFGEVVTELLITDTEEQTEFAITNRRRHKQIKEERRLVGIIFQMLVERDINICIQSPFSAELIKLMHSPKKYEIYSLGVISHPDMITNKKGEDGNIIITSVIDAKMGRLNLRSIRQLEQEGFKKSLEKVVTLLNSNKPSFFRGKKLFEIAKAMVQNPGDLEISSEFQQVVVIPRNKDSWDIVRLFNWESLRLDSMTPDDKLEYAKGIIEGNNVVFRSSCFSSAEIYALLEYFKSKKEDI